MTEHDDERELLKRIADDDRAAFTILYSRYLNNLYRYIYLFTKSKDTSEDIIQNVFIKIWERRETLGVIILKNGLTMQPIRVIHQLDRLI